MRIIFIGLCLTLFVCCTKTVSKSDVTPNANNGDEVKSISHRQEATNEVSTKPIKSLIKSKRRWQVGNYKGLVLGKATIEDILRILGTPTEIADLKSVGNVKDWAYHYKDQKDIKGDLLVYVDKKTKTASSVIITPNSMSRKEVFDFFGQDYLVTRYSFSNCPGETFDSAPFYEDPSGNTEFIEYRDKGIAVLISEDEMVKYISYLKEPVGIESLECKK